MTPPLAVLGGPPTFAEPMHVGRPNIGDRDELHRKLDVMLDRRWLTNGGPFVQELEARLQELLQVRNVIAVCNGTIGLEIASRALAVRGEVVVPSFTFVATAHAMAWQGATPVFADVAPGSHLIDPESVRSVLTPNASLIIGVHTWGMAAPVERLVELGDAHGLPVLFDAAHAFGCTHRRRPIGGSGAAEVFSFHATKYINALEGGAVATNDDDLAERVRSMTNFGFTGYDQVSRVGTNAKMTEFSAAVALTSIDSEPSFAAHNQEIHAIYRERLDGVDHLRLTAYDDGERNSHQYVVFEVGGDGPLSRDHLVEALHAERCLARRYFYPGVHRMEPYASTSPMAGSWLGNTEALADRVMVLPTGTSVSPSVAHQVCDLVQRILDAGPAVRRALDGRAPR